MANLFYSFVAFIASVIGTICGMGGGIIIKPVLDATSGIDIVSIGFLSGMTVFFMSTVSVVKMAMGQKKIASSQEKVLDYKVTIPLTIGAIFGGILGRNILSGVLKGGFSNRDVGLVQAILILLLTAVSLIYTVFQSRVKQREVEGWYWSLLVGLALGTMSSFLGIGGGPINIVVLNFFFSMDTKKAASNSLFIIMFSQMANLLNTIIAGEIPPVDRAALLLMVVGGIIGAQVGGLINKKISVKTVNKLFIVVMMLLVMLNAYNIIVLL